MTVWFAARIVYVDSSLNAQLGAGPEATAPRLVTPTGPHCGPVSPPRALGVDFESVAAKTIPGGVAITWTTAVEDQTLGFEVLRDAAQPVATIAATGSSSHYRVVDPLPQGASARGRRYRIQELTAAGPGTVSASFEVADGNPPRGSLARAHEHRRGAPRP